MNRVFNEKVYEFNGFRLERAQRRLLHLGRSIPLTQKAFDLLLFLVEMRGQLVEKHDLMREIWPNTIVEENNITVSISKLRKVLGDDRAGPQFIETVARRGYRFVAHVTETSQSPSGRHERHQTTQTAGIHVSEMPIDSLAVLPLQTPGSSVTIDYLDILGNEVDEMLAGMQTQKSRKGMKAAFNASPIRLGRAAVKGARRKT